MSQSPISSSNFLDDTGVHRLPEPTKPLRLKTIGLYSVLAVSLCINLLLLSDLGRTSPPPTLDDHPFTARAVLAGEAHEEEVELALYMGRMQQYTQKLGFAIDHKNQPLAAFYHHELEENLDEIIKEVKQYDGMPIAAPAKSMTLPHVALLEEALEKGDWEQIALHYRNVVNSCNMCHQQTKHGFIKITTTTDAGPFNQDFRP